MMGHAPQQGYPQHSQGFAQRPSYAVPNSPQMTAPPGFSAPTAADRFVAPDPHKQCPMKYMCPTISAVPDSPSLLTKAGVPFGIAIQPLADPETNEDAIPVVNLPTIVRCKKCRTYINPFISMLEGNQR